MTVRENLLMGGLINIGRRSLDFDLVYKHGPFPKDRLSRRGGTLSGGQQATHAIVRALIGGSHLLLLDEPSDGVQPRIIHEIGEFIQKLNQEQGLTVLIVEQNIEVMQTVGMRAYALDKGRVVAEIPRDSSLVTEQVATFLAV